MNGEEHEGTGTWTEAFYYFGIGFLKVLGWFVVLLSAYSLKCGFPFG